MIVSLKTNDDFIIDRLRLICLRAWRSSAGVWGKNVSCAVVLSYMNRLKRMLLVLKISLLPFKTSTLKSEVLAGPVRSTTSAGAELDTSII